MIMCFHRLVLCTYNSILNKYCVTDLKISAVIIKKVLLDLGGINVTPELPLTIWAH